jgi:O-antigen/teichoic acid export membrane protein
MVAVQLIGEADKLMLGAMTTPESVGVYTVAHKIALFSLLPMWTVGEACKPRFASLMKNAEQASLEKFVHQASLLMFSSSLPLLAVLYIVAETVLRVFGEEFVSGAAVLRILLVGEAVAAACGPAGPLLNMTGHHRAVRNTLFAGLLINILANSILIPRFGLIGAATASTTARIAWNITFAAHVHKTHRITTVALFIPLISRR